MCQLRISRQGLNAFEREASAMPAREIVAQVRLRPGAVLPLRR